MTVDVDARIAQAGRGCSLNGEKTPPLDTQFQTNAAQEESPHNQGSTGGPGVQRSTAGIADQEYISGWKLFGVLAAVTMAVFLTLLDMSIIGTAIPRITSDFNSLDEVGWYGSAYQLSSAALQPLSGKLYNYFKLKWTWLAFFLLFEIGSLICGLATSSTMLIAGRVVAGMGGSGLMGGALNIIAASLPVHKQPMCIGIMLGLSQLGVVVGPLIGGVFTEFVSWRWCFYLNLPIGVVVAFLIALVSIPEQTPKPPARSVFTGGFAAIARKFDPLGFVLMASAAVMLLLGLEFGGKKYPWNGSVIIGLFCGCFATFVLLFFWMRHCGDDALIPISMIRHRVIWASTMAMAWLMSSSLTTAYFLPLYFQSVREATPSKSGVYTLPTILSQLTFAIGSGILIPKIGYYIPVAAVGAATNAVGSGLLSTLTPFSPPGHWVGFQIIAGAGRGLFMQVPILAVQNHLAGAQVSLGMAAVVFSQTLATAIFLSISSSVFVNSLSTDLQRQAPDANAAAVIAAGATAFRKVVRPEDVPGVLLAYTTGLNRVFYVVTSVACLAFVFVWGMGWTDIRKGKEGSGEKSSEGV